MLSADNICRAIPDGQRPASETSCLGWNPALRPGTCRLPSLATRWLGIAAGASEREAPRWDPARRKVDPQHGLPIHVVAEATSFAATRAGRVGRRCGWRPVALGVIGCARAIADASGMVDCSTPDRSAGWCGAHLCLGRAAPSAVQRLRVGQTPRQPCAPPDLPIQLPPRSAASPSCSGASTRSGRARFVGPPASAIGLSGPTLHYEDAILRGQRLLGSRE